MNIRLGVYHSFEIAFTHQRVAHSNVNVKDLGNGKSESRRLIFDQFNLTISFLSFPNCF